MLAYVFWHRPQGGGTPRAEQEYEQALAGFHRSLARTPPAGTLASAAFRLARAPWQQEGAGPLYEDWYLVEDFAALGVLNQAAVGSGHRTAHEQVARRSGFGAGAVYAALEGDGGLGGGLAVWVTPAPGTQALALAELLADGIDPRRASLWRRQLVLGPAPELCLLAPETPAGAAATRLPPGWTALEVARTAVVEPDADRFAGPSRG